MHFEFTLLFALPANAPTLEVMMDALAAQGCTDALVGWGRPGYVALQCVRDAATAHDALITTVAAVERAIPGARFEQVAQR